MNFFRSIRRGASALLLATITLCTPSGVLFAQSVLRKIDSVVVRETESFSLSKLGSMTMSSRGHIFVSDVGEGRVLQIAPNGTIVGQFGKKGDGPGEMQFPSSVVIIRDSLYVLSSSQRRVSVFSVDTRKYARSFKVTIGNFATLATVSGQLLALDIDPKTFTPITRLSTTGAVLGTEGSFPDFVKKDPMLAQVPGQFGVAERGSDVWETNSFSQSLFRWKRGSTAIAEELALPVVRRRGVAPDKYLQMLRDPGKTASLVYDFSFPQLLQFISPDVLALVTLDPTMEKGNFFGTHYLTLIDVKAKTVCADILLPISTDPLPRVAIKSDTLVVLQQGSNKSDDVVSSLLRFRIDPKQCTFKPL